MAVSQAGHARAAAGGACAITSAGKKGGNIGFCISLSPIKIRARLCLHLFDVCRTEVNRMKQQLTIGARVLSNHFMAQDIQNAPLRWLHLSDLHFDTSDPVDRDFMLDSLCDFIKTYSQRKAIDLIFISGDLAYSGKAQEYAKFGVFLERLICQAGVERSHIFVVPGNHDINRNEIEFLVRTLENQEKIDKYFAQGAGLQHIVEGFRAYREWHDKFFVDRPPVSLISTCMANTSIVVRNVRVCVVQLNTAIFSRDESDNGNLIVGRTCLRDAVKGLSEDSDLKIAIAHHPIDWLHEAERPNIRSALRETFDILLHGHLHDADAHTAKSADGELITLVAGATYQTEKYPNFFWIGEWDGTNVELKLIRYDKNPSSRWSIDGSVSRDPDVNCIRLPLEKQMSVTPNPIETKIVEGDAEPTFVADHLLISQRGEMLYVEPRLFTVPIGGGGVPVQDEHRVSVEHIVSSEESFIIESGAEYGATTLGSRLEQGINRAGFSASFVNARHITQHGPELASDIGMSSGTKVLIIDDFDLADHAKLIRNILKIPGIIRIILITIPTATFKRATDSDVKEIAAFKAVFHWPISRSDVRSLSEKFFDENKLDLLNAVVDKVYGDLVSLKIPLTPPNVIMYLRVLSREENFAPLNRVDIVAGYVAELLRRSSDILNDSFNAKSKIDVLSAFAYKLFEDEQSCFTLSDWNKFVKEYKEETLFHFDGNSLLAECERVKLLVRHSHAYYFRYHFYFPLLVGKYISARPNRVEQFIAYGWSDRLEGLIEVISGLASDNTHLITSLNARLGSLLEEFERDYINQNFYPYRKLEWISDKSKEEEVWERIENKLSRGPAEGKEIDNQKSSILGEIQANNQSVAYNKMVSLEASVFRVAADLTVALKNSESVSGKLKLASATLIYSIETIALQVGFLLAPLIVKNHIIQWGGVAFVNMHFYPAKDNGAEGTDPRNTLQMILSILPMAVLGRMGENISSRRLSAVFHRLSETLDKDSFAYLANFHAIIQARGQDWETYARRAIVETDRGSFALRVMLSVLMQAFDYSVSTAVERDVFKNLIALIHSKRGKNVNRPKTKLIERVRQSLESKGRFATKDSA